MKQQQQQKHSNTQTQKKTKPKEQNGIANYSGNSNETENARHIIKT